MPRLKYRRPELVLYSDAVVGGCNSEQVSGAECSCDCAASQCDLVGVPITGCSVDTGAAGCTRCTDGTPC